jgi:hypothetical protein
MAGTGAARSGRCRPRPIRRSITSQHPDGVASEGRVPVAAASSTASPSIVPAVPDGGPPADTSDRGVALLLAVAAVAAALITLVAVNASSDSSSAWQSALRQEVARGVAAVEDIRYVYEVEAPGAFQIASQEVLAEEFRTAASSASPDLRPGLEARAQTLEMTVAALRSSIELATAAYAMPGGGYDTLKRLAERLSDPARRTYDPDGTMARGDQAAARSVRLMDSIVVIGFAFLFGALAQAFRGARRPLLIVGWVALGAGVAAAFATGPLL